MPKFSGKIGYATTVESAPSVFEDVIREVSVRGDVELVKDRFRQAEYSVQDDVSSRNIISIIATKDLQDHVFDMRYVKWMGAYLKIRDVSIELPRVKLTLGGVYNGPKPA